MRTKPSIWSLLLLAVFVVLWSGCTAAHHRKAADKEAYSIILRVESEVLGRTNEFSIETSYSGRKPAEILPSELIDDRQQTNRRLLTIEGALDLAVRSRRYQTEKERLYLTALTLTGERNDFGPQFIARSSGSLDRTGQARTSGSGTNFMQDSPVTTSGSLNNRISVNQLLKSGGSVGLTVVNDLFRYYTGNPERSIVSTISVDLFQPLLRGFGRNSAAVESLTQAERNVVYAVRNYGFFQSDFAVEIVNDYFSLLAQKDVIRNRYTNYLGRVTSVRRLEARRDREQRLAVDQARQAELSARNNYINALAGYQTALDQFKIKLGLPLGDKIGLDDDALTRVEKTGLVPVNLDPNEAYRLAVDRQLQILNAIDAFEDSRRQVRLAADRFKPGLNLFADASLTSERPTDYTRFDPKDVRAGVGFELDLPIDRVRDRNNYRATLISFESALRTLTLRLDTLKDSIERGLRTLQQRRQNYEIQRNALALANQRVLGSTESLQAGRSEIRDLLEAQDAQIAAQNAVTSALVDYQEARLQLMLDIGTINTGGDRFWLKDHLADFLPRPASATVAAGTVTEVIPPDDFFKE